MQLHWTNTLYCLHVSTHSCRGNSWEPHSVIMQKKIGSIKSTEDNFIKIIKIKVPRKIFENNPGIFLEIFKIFLEYADYSKIPFYHMWYPKFTLSAASMGKPPRFHCKALELHPSQQSFIFSISLYNNLVLKSTLQYLVWSCPRHLTMFL